MDKYAWCARRYHRLQASTGSKIERKHHTGTIQHFCVALGGKNMHHER